MDPMVDPKKKGTISDHRFAEIRYHKKFNRRVILFALPIYLFFVWFSFLRGFFAQGIIFSALSANVVVTYLLGLYIKDLGRLVLLKWVGTAIAFILLAASMVIGLLDTDIYIALPWIFTYPTAVLLMFGERIGIIFALGFFAVVSLVVLGTSFPAWNAVYSHMFKLNTLFSLMTGLVIALFAERTRVRMRNSLLDARNKYKTAEQRQRDTNEELKSEIEMRAHSEKALSLSESRYRTLFEESSVSLWEVNLVKVKVFLDDLPMEVAENLEGYLEHNPDELRRCIKNVWVTAVNRAGLKLYGAENLKQVLENIDHVLPPNLLDYMRQLISSLHRTGSHSTQLEARTLQGRKLHTLVNSTIPAGYEQSWEKVFTSVYDITERVNIDEEKKRIDGQLQHTRQIQAIASLAGGIAHQFNNALAVISGNLDLMELNLHADKENIHYIRSLRESSERISRLTEQLLAYARGGKYQPRDFPLKELVEKVVRGDKMPRNPSCRFTTRFEDGIYLVRADIIQITIALEAALINAVEAMTNGGEIGVTVRRLLLNHTDGADPDLPSGEYAVMTIEDHGVGMDDETRQRIFEPFFSTKFVGRGLGMAAAYGIVRNHDGMIDVQSTPGQGTRVCIYLPCTQKGH